jgi:transposase
MKLYVGADLHANNIFVAVIDKKGKRVEQKKLPNDLPVILEYLKPRQKEIVGIVVESTFNWYWLVDGLMGTGYKVHLANPSAIQQYSGLKHVDDKHDAFWLAQMLRLEILPEGYIYPKEERPIRDLLRKRRHLVKLRTSLLVSLQNIISRNCGIQFRANEMKLLKDDRVSPLLEGNEDLALAGKASKETIDQLTRQIHRNVPRPESRAEGVLPVSAHASGGGKDLGLDHHAGDGADRPFCPSGRLCFLLSEGPQPMDQ